MRSKIIAFHIQADSKKTGSPQRQPGYHFDPWLSVPASQQVWLFWTIESHTKSVVDCQQAKNKNIEVICQFSDCPGILQEIQV